MKLYLYLSTIAFPILFTVFVFPNLQYIFSNTYLFFIFVSFVLFCVITYRNWSEPETGFKPYLFGNFVLGFLFTTLLFVSLGTDFKILADETNLLNSSQAFLYKGEFTHPIEGIFSFGKLEVISERVPHRHGLWSFLVYIVHLLLGYSYKNAFIINYIISVFCFVAMASLGTTLFNKQVGRFSAVILFSVPLYMVYATSAGFDLLNLLFLIFIIHSMYLTIRKPTTENIEWLLYSFLLGSHVRYEVAAILLVIVPLVLFYLYQHRLKVTLPILLFPMLFTTVVWQRLLSTDIANEGSGVTNPIQLDKFMEHFGNGIQFFFTKGDATEYPNSILLSILALLGIAYMIYWFYTKKDKQMFLFITLTIAIYAILTSAHFAYYLGDYRFSVVNRYAMIHYIYISLLSSFVLFKVSSILKKDISILAYTFLGLLYMLSLPIAIRNQKVNGLILYRDFSYTRKYFENIKEPILIVSDRPSMYLSLQQSSISISTFNNHREKFLTLLNEKSVDDIYIIRHYFQVDKPAESIDPPLELQEEKSFFLKSGNYVKVFKVRLPDRQYTKKGTIM